MSSDEQKWWLAPPGMRPEGPFTVAEIRSRVESAPKDTDWQVCMEGSVEWQPLADLPAFSPPVPSPEPTNPPTSSEGDINNFMVWMHLSQLSNLLIPPAGIVIPIILWVVKKDENELLDRQGREITNWLIFYTIVIFGMSILSVVPFVACVSLPILLVMAILGIIYPIIGATKASRGEFQHYPMFFRVIS